MKKKPREIPREASTGRQCRPVTTHLKPLPSHQSPNQAIPLLHKQHPKNPESSKKISHNTTARKGGEQNEKPKQLNPFEKSKTPLPFSHPSSPFHLKPQTKNRSKGGGEELEKPSTEIDKEEDTRLFCYNRDHTTPTARSPRRHHCLKLSA